MSQVATKGRKRRKTTLVPGRFAARAPGSVAIETQPPAMHFSQRWARAFKTV